MKPKVHRFRVDCEKDMLEMALKLLGQNNAKAVGCELAYDRNFEIVDNTCIHSYSAYGMHVEVKITFPDTCKVCGNDKRRLDMKYGRNW